MAKRYLQAHFERFGEQDLRDNVYYFDMPDTIPGFTFFDIRSDIQAGMSRVDAMQNKADHYDEIMQFVMRGEDYNDSKVAPTLLSAFIKSLFDEEYGDRQYEGTDIDRTRESPDYFTHNDLEHVAEELKRYQNTQGMETDGQTRTGSIPETSDPRIKRTLMRHVESQGTDFETIINAVFNRLDYIREDTHLRKIFDNTNNAFDFRDHLNEDCVILFDLGGLRDEASKIMTGIILTNLWDAVETHDEHSCTVGHDNPQECKQHARETGYDENYPPCREPWDDDHLINLIIDEAASVTISEMMSKLFEQGRGFNLSFGLAAQYPKQLEESGDESIFNTIFNNVGTLLFGKLRREQAVAEVLSHENIDAEEFKHRLSHLPEGEWIAQLPSPQFGETGPEPFSLLPLEPPAGHPASDNSLTEANKRYIERLIRTDIKQTMTQQYSIEATPDTDSHTSRTKSASPTQPDPAPSHQPQEPNPQTPTQNGSRTQNKSSPPQNGAATTQNKSLPPQNSKTTPSNTTHSAQNNGQPESEHSQHQPEHSTAQPSNTPPQSKTPDQQYSSQQVADPTEQQATSAMLPSHVTKTPSGAHCTRCGTTYPETQLSTAAECCSSTAETQQGQSEDNAGSRPAQAAREDTSQSTEHISQSSTTDTPAHIQASGGEYTTIPTAKGSLLEYQLNSVIQPVKLSQSQINEQPLSESSLDFLSTVLAVMNNNTPLPRYASLRPLKQHFTNQGVDIDALKDAGYVTEHRLAPTITYTVEPKGRDLLADTQTVRQGGGVGDIGDGMPHRFGADLTMEWLATKPEIDTVQSFRPINDTQDPADQDIIDILGITTQTGTPEPLTAVEIEGGRSQTESAIHGGDGRAGGRNYTSLANDYEMMEHMATHPDAHDQFQAIWVCRNETTCQEVLTALSQKGYLPAENDLAGILAKKRGIQELNEKLRSSDYPGISSIYTFNTIKTNLQQYDPTTEAQRE